MADEVLIRVEGLSKKFCRDLRTSLRYGVADLTRDIFGRPRTSGLRDREFWAVHDVSFELQRGEVLGLLGHNGAGKTTLLRILNGLIKPDAGRVELKGRVGALIALGAGFNPILTGRENVYINAAVLGMDRREVDARMDDIISFSEIGEFIDTPVRNYSSGMNVRLGFSVAAMLIKPDILFLDEVLAVGDIGFTIKCLNTVRTIAADAAVVFVSHSMPQVATFCSRTIVMDHGRVTLDTEDPADGIDRYYELSKQSENVTGLGGARLRSFAFIVDGEVRQEVEPRVQHGADCRAVVEFEVDAGRTGALCTVLVDDPAMQRLLNVPVMGERDRRVFPPGVHRIEVPLGCFDFNAGKYSFLLTFLDADSRHILYRHQGLSRFRVVADRFHTGRIVRPTVAIDLPVAGDPSAAP
jgi:lipopolysaccharide transport system ATP-binding protein